MDELLLNGWRAGQGGHDWVMAPRAWYEAVSEVDIVSDSLASSVFLEDGYLVLRVIHDLMSLRDGRCASG